MDGSRMKGLKMTVNKDIDIIRYVKKEMMKGELGQFIELNVYVLKKDGGWDNAGRVQVRRTQH